MVQTLPRSESSEATSAPSSDVEVLFKEARRRERRRRLLAAAAAVVVVAAGVAAGVVSTTRHQGSGRLTTKNAPALPRTAVVSCAHSVAKLHMILRGEGAGAGSRAWGVMISSTTPQPCMLDGTASINFFGTSTTPPRVSSGRSDTDSPNTIPSRETKPLATIDTQSGTTSNLGIEPAFVEATRPVSFLFYTSGGGAFTDAAACPFLTRVSIRLPDMPTSHTLEFPVTPVPIHDVTGPINTSDDCDVVGVSPLFQGTPRRGMCPACYTPSTPTRRVWPTVERTPMS